MLRPRGIRLRRLQTVPDSSRQFPRTNLLQSPLESYYSTFETAPSGQPDVGQPPPSSPSSLKRGMNENNLDEGSADQGEALHDSVRDLVSSAPIFTPIPHLRKNCWIQNSALIFLFLPATLSSSALQFDFGAFFMDSRFLLTADCRARPAAFTPFHLLNLTLFLEKASRVVSLREVRGSQARSCLSHPLCELCSTLLPSPLTIHSIASLAH